MITVSKKTEYSIIFLTYLAKKKGETVSLAQVSKTLKLPYRFLGQISMSLKTSGILESKEGKNGGYLLKEGWQDKSLYDLLKALGENKPMVQCLGLENSCRREESCSIKRIFSKVEERFLEDLKNITLKEL